MTTYKEYAEDEVATKAKKTVLDKKGLVILLVSLILAIASIVTGIILFDVDEDDYREPSESTYYINTSSSYTYDVDSYEYITFEFSTYNSGNYLIKINGAEVYSVKDNYGYTLSTYSEYGYSYEEVKRVYLDSYTTYKVRVYTGSNYGTVAIRVDYY
jgi:hypothetical protein